MVTLSYHDNVEMILDNDIIVSEYHVISYILENSTNTVNVYIYKEKIHAFLPERIILLNGELLTSSYSTPDKNSHLSFNLKT
jgi:hypothetical protein